MKRYLHLTATLVLFLLAITCSDGKAAETRQTPAAPKTSPIFRSISPQEAKALIQTRKDLLLVDVRSPEELSAGSIPGSQLIPFGELARGRMSLPAGQPLLLICAVGGRSYAVGQYFSGKGYREIYNLSGGIRAWKAAGLELQRR
jgi:rhodanese-related sulfurtransferase